MDTIVTHDLMNCSTCLIIVTQRFSKQVTHHHPDSAVWVSEVRGRNTAEDWSSLISGVRLVKIMKKPELSIKPSDNSLMINFVGFLILCIGGLCIYQRYIEREKTELETQNTIIGFHEYVKENIK